MDDHEETPREANEREIKTDWLAAELRAEMAVMPETRARHLLTVMRHGRSYPFATTLSLVSIPIGFLAMFIGQDVSRAFQIVYHRPEPIYIWGVALLLGGINVAWGIGIVNPGVERAGLCVLAVAYGFYGVSVMLGLGVGGLVAGPTFLALALACLLRARVIVSNARTLVAITEKARRDAGGD
jgi:hypothetical protein